MVNSGFKFTWTSNINDIRKYLNKHHVITEINTVFLTVGDPDSDPKVIKKINKLNKYEKDRYVFGEACVYDENIKCIYDTKVIHSQKSLDYICKRIIPKD